MLASSLSALPGQLGVDAAPAAPTVWRQMPCLSFLRRRIVSIAKHVSGKSPTAATWGVPVWHRHVRGGQGSCHAAVPLFAPLCGGWYPAAMFDRILTAEAAQTLQDEADRDGEVDDLAAAGGGGHRRPGRSTYRIAPRCSAVFAGGHSAEQDIGIASQIPPSSSAAKGRLA